MSDQRFADERLPTMTQRYYLRWLDRPMLEMFDRHGSLTKEQLTETSREIVRGEGVPPGVTDFWWRFAVRRGLLEQVAKREPARLTNAGRARLRGTRGFVPAGGMFDGHLGRWLLGLAAIWVTFISAVAAAAPEPARLSVLSAGLIPIVAGTGLLVALTTVFGALEHSWVSRRRWQRAIRQLTETDLSAHPSAAARPVVRLSADASAWSLPGSRRCVQTVGAQHRSGTAEEDRAADCVSPGRR